MRPHGYTNIDAIDGSKDMLAMAQQKELYKNYYIALLGAHRKAPVADGMQVHLIVLPLNM